MEDVGAAHKVVRVQRLDRMSVAAERRDNFHLAASLLEQVAKEVGNVYSNRRELTGRDGGPVQHQDVDTMTPEQMTVELATLMGMTPEEVAERFRPTRPLVEEGEE